MTRLFPCVLAALLCLAATAVHAQDDEPSVREVVRMALSASRSMAPERMRELSRRARLSGLLPTLRVSAQRGLEQGSSSTQSSASDRTNATVGDDLTLEASLTFELPRLVFATEEVRVASVQRWLDADRRKLVQDVIRLYFQRRRLLRERAAAAAVDAEAELALAEVEAMLDALTNGAYGDALERLRAARTKGARDDSKRHANVGAADSLSAAPSERAASVLVPGVATAPP